MGCYYYNLASKPDSIIMVTGFDSCLCNFPHTENGKTLTPLDVEMLACLGAAVAMVQSGEIEDGYVPGSLPSWIRDEISRIVYRKNSNDSPVVISLIKNPEGGWTSVRNDIPGAISQGRTPDDALDNLRDAVSELKKAK